MRRNTDSEGRSLERRAVQGDPEALAAFVERIGPRTGDWAWVARVIVAAGPAATNAVMDDTDYPTWNRLAPLVYADAASWAPEDLRRAEEILHERLLEGGCSNREASWERCAFPALSVAIGVEVPAELNGVGARPLSGRPGVAMPSSGWALCGVRELERQRLPSGGGFMNQEALATIFLAVLDEERGCVACATATEFDYVGGHPTPWMVLRWSALMNLRGDGGPLAWARDVDAFDRLLLPLPVLRAWQRRAAAYLSRSSVGQGGPIQIMGGGQAVQGQGGPIGPIGNPRRRRNPHLGRFFAAERYVSPRERELTTKEAVVRGVSYGLKYADPPALTEAVRVMAPLLPKRATLVPIPTSSGNLEPNAELAARLAAATGGVVARLIERRRPVPSSRERRLRGDPGLTAEDQERSLRATGAVPSGPVVLIDNVLTTGATFEGAWRTLGRPANVTGLAYAEAREVLGS